MKAIAVTITRFIDDYQPGFVECSLTDAFGQKHIFHEKVPVVTDKQLDVSSQYPQEGLLACKIISFRVSETDKHIILADTSEPWGIESIDGYSRFEIFEEKLREI